MVDIDLALLFLLKRGSYRLTVFLGSFTMINNFLADAYLKKLVVDFKVSHISSV